MRFINLVLGVVGVGALAAAGMVGCGSSNNGNTGGSSGTASTSSGTGGSAPCAPRASCTAVDKTCMGLVDNTGKTTFGLRMNEIDISAPMVLASGTVSSLISNFILPSSMTCNLPGSATFNWLMQFDTTAMTLKTGGAKPVTDATMGYSFDDEMVAQGSQTFHVQPITFTNVVPDSSGNFTISTGQDLIVPIFLDATGSSTILLPLKQARLAMATLSASQNCIGSYNAAGLDPSGNCLPDYNTTPALAAFLDGGSIDGHITLADADGVVISTLSESLCVLLSGNTAGDGASPTQHCTKDASGNITFMGDWCDATNSAGGCKDSVQLKAQFAASSITIN